ncbi:MAG: hypothetical protein LBN05_07310 [Oscillospiraceae bacterium]|jgi:hypothetical protein|nr:hypothetical protein [Oscillospiraceae bacterium]
MSEQSSTVEVFSALIYQVLQNFQQKLTTFAWFQDLLNNILPKVLG